MNKNRMLYIVIGILVLGIALLIIYFTSERRSTGNTEGTMNVMCPVKVYKQGESFISPCFLRTGQDCDWEDPQGCDFIIKNVCDMDIHEGTRTSVFKVEMRGTVQYMEIQIIELQ
jgi:hypothetical protein